MFNPRDQFNTKMVPIPVDDEDDDSSTIQQRADEELKAIGGSDSLENQLYETGRAYYDRHNPDEDLHVEVHLDWAAQIRLQTNMSWADCLKVASIWYYG